MTRGILISLIILFATDSAVPKILNSDDKANLFWHAEERCLTDNIYHEARGESKKDWAIIMDVVLNRLKLAHYPETICGVVYQRSQFSWTINPRNDKIDFDTWTIINFYVKDRLKKGVGITKYKFDHYYAHNKISPPNWTEKYKSKLKLKEHTYYEIY
jgi:N-acetylmuramoyl-L-alanine amidase